MKLELISRGETKSPMWPEHPQVTFDAEQTWPAAGRELMGAVQYTQP